jgi:hypothetical protein
MFDRSALDDHPAHRGANQVSRLDPEMIHQADGVIGHVAEVVGRGATVADGHRQHIRHPRRLDPARAADVAVVEADDAEAALGQRRAELLGPGDHLGRQAHHQQQRLAVRVAHLLVAELDPVDRREKFVTEAMHP